MFMKKPALCTKCDTPLSMSLFSCLVAPHGTYVCPRCGVLCSFCVEVFDAPRPVCKYCGSQVAVLE